MAKFVIILNKFFGDLNFKTGFPLIGLFFTDFKNNSASFPVIGAVD
ncbi:MAG: hypothetical protein ACD_79C00887G0003 [uncultured bacterium]|nr:MAG: hypothetical protein ACD_79C00887G0003 [uncultured bacterium]